MPKILTDVEAESRANPREIVTVRGTQPPNKEPYKGGGYSVILWERHPAHPNGEILLADEKPQQVALTPGVVKVLSAGLVEEIAPLPATKK